MVAGHRRALAGLALLTLLGLPASASAQGKPYHDAGQGRRSERTLTRAMKADRTALTSRLGAQAVLDVDAATGTPRVLGKLDGALSAPSSQDPVQIADAYVRAHLSALGLTEADMATFGAATTATSPSGITQVRRRQTFGGIPSSGSELRVNVARDGSVINVLGSPAHDLSVGSVAPGLDAGEAVRAIQDAIGSYRSLPKAKGPAGATRTTTFSDGTTASLELFQRSADARLAWRVMYKAAPDAVYDAVVDARTGDVLQRTNIVKSDTSGLVWERYPGPAGAFGTQRLVDMAGWLTSATTLTGPNAHAYSDVNDDDTPQAAEEVAPGPYAFQPVTTTSLGCDALHLCSWTNGPGGWQPNRQQDAVQAFYYANRFHDHLAAAPIGFTPAWGSFDGDDKLEINTDDGANAPDSDHLNNANMATPRDGISPRMQMYLFKAGSGSRQVNGGDDAAIVYHEYTHGLSNRLVTATDGGPGALNSAQAGAMGEAWSDWYAMDYLVDEGYVVDTPADGEVDVGEYTDATPNQLRSQPADCAVGLATVVDACKNDTPAGNGGYTYGDFGKVAGRPEVHADGEIWLETLWDVRKALGSELSEQIITDAMRLSPPEPSFLDERNAILQADQAATGGANRIKLWQVFAARGMGYFAGTEDGGDASPTEDFSMPPDPGAPRGTITGTVTSGDSGQPMSGVTVGIPGLMSGLETLKATTDADGRYTITGVPEASYPRLIFTVPGWDTVSRPVQVVGGVTTTRAAILRRDWASGKRGASVDSSNHDEYDDLGCGPDGAIDQSLVTGWSSENPTSLNDVTNRVSPVQMVIRLPVPVDVLTFGIDPKYTCGDGNGDSTGSARVETSPNCTDYTQAGEWTFGADDWGRLNERAPGAGGANVLCVRLSLLSSFGGNTASWRDLSEFGVYTSPAPIQPAATDPTPTPTATPTATATATATPTASSTPTPPPPPVATPTPAATPKPFVAAPPRLQLPSSGKQGAAAFKVRCEAACKVSASLGVDAKTARKLGLKTLGTRTTSLSKTGTQSITVKLSAKARRALKRHKLKSVTVTLKVSARYGGATAVTTTRRVKVKV